ncbi:MAG: divalent-cation tolerance protein CutA [Gemmatimonadetes bacterium]|nr:divalent-cation tolerance protein CutA [Gemmatimonadota bacterium]
MAESGASGVRVVLVTAPDSDVAEQIVNRVVGEGLAACGNIVQGVTSIFWWEGAVQRAAEVLIILKTTSAASDRLIRRIVDVHPYEVPEVLILPVAAGHEPYVAWVGESSRPRPSEAP